MTIFFKLFLIFLIMLCGGTYVGLYVLVETGSTLISTLSLCLYLAAVIMIARKLDGG